MAGGLFGTVSFYHKNTLSLEYFTAGIVYRWNSLSLEYFTIGLFLYCSMLFCCVDVSTIGNIFGPSHNPC